MQVICLRLESQNPPQLGGTKRVHRSDWQGTVPGQIVHWVHAWELMKKGICH